MKTYDVTFLVFPTVVEKVAVEADSMDVDRDGTLVFLAMGERHPYSVNGSMVVVQAFAAGVWRTVKEQRP